MKLFTKKTLSIFVAVVMCLCLCNLYGANVKADENTITGNNTKATAHNFGSWSSINYNSKPIVLEKDLNESWVKFTLAPGDRIYVRSSYNANYEGEWFEIQNELGTTLFTRDTPGDVLNLGAANQGVYLDCDNLSSSTSTFYLVLHRGSVDENVSIYYSLSAYNRIKNLTKTVNVTGTASNPGNTGLSPSGVDSSVLTVNLTNNTSFPNGAIVMNITSSGTQTPSQGNVRHMVMPANPGIWYTSTTPSSTNGYYSITLNDNIPVKQIWSFKYNARAAGKSTMRNVKLRIKFQYDLNQTGYVNFL